MRKIILFNIIFLLSFQIVLGQKEKIPYGGIVNGKATYLPKPEYPQEAKDFCISGKVEIAVLISEEGNVIEAKAISGEEIFHKVSVKAVKKAKFLASYTGIPIKTKGIIVYNFPPVKNCLIGGVVNKKATKLIKPLVPNLNQPKHLRITEQQIIGVQIVIDMNGKVIYAKSLNGHPLLRSACEVAARKTEFSPTFIGGPLIKYKVLLVYKFKTDGMIETDIEKDDKFVIGTSINLVEPSPVSCNCKFGINSSVLVEAKIDEKGNVIEAKAITGHPAIKNVSEKAALNSKFLLTNIKAKILIQYNFVETDKWSVKIKNIEIKVVEIET